MDKVKAVLARDKFAAHCGIELLQAAPGYAKGKMTITPNHFNGVGIVQGGSIFTLADVMFAVASNSHGTVAVAINTSMSFVKAATGGTLYAEAKETSINHKIATYDVKVTDDDNNTVALFQGMVYRKDKKLEEVLNLV